MEALALFTQPDGRHLLEAPPTGAPSSVRRRRGWRPVGIPAALGGRFPRRPIGKLDGRSGVVSFSAFSALAWGRSLSLRGKMGLFSARGESSNSSNRRESNKHFYSLIGRCKSIIIVNIQKLQHFPLPV